eukprot:SAG31_NODE_478_length_15144_cov_15.165769_19_plen_225_part_00
MIGINATNSPRAAANAGRWPGTREPTEASCCRQPRGQVITPYSLLLITPYSLLLITPYSLLLTTCCRQPRSQRDAQNGGLRGEISQQHADSAERRRSSSLAVRARHQDHRTDVLGRQVVAVPLRKLRVPRAARSRFDPAQRPQGAAVGGPSVSPMPRRGGTHARTQTAHVSARGRASRLLLLLTPYSLLLTPYSLLLTPYSLLLTPYSLLLLNPCDKRLCARSS